MPLNIFLSMVLDTQKEPAKRQITPKKTNKNFTLLQVATNIKTFLQELLNDFV